MPISICHFTDSAKDNTVVHLDAYGNKRGTYEIHVEGDKIASVGLKLEGRVAVINSGYFYEFFSQGLAYGSSSLAREKFGGKPLPVCVKYKSETCIVIERPPFKINPNIRYSRRAYRESAKYIREPDIWIPWTVVLLVCNRGFNTRNARIVSYLFFRDEPLSSFDDVVILPYTPNIFNDGRICMGDGENRFMDAINNGDFALSDISSVYSFIMNEYFMGGWNMDLGHVILNEAKEVFSKIVSPENRASTLELAKSHGNYYIIKCLKKISAGRDAHLDSKDKSVKFYLNYLSCLDLNQTLEHVKLLIERSHNLHNPYTNSRKAVQLGHVLTRHDSSFSQMHNKIYKLATHWNSDAASQGERDSAELARHCISSTSNRTPLHTWALCIEFELEDFLNYASEKILDKYDEWSNYYFIEFEKGKRQWGREKFYKDSIAASLVSQSLRPLLCELAFMYINKLKRYSNMDVLYDAVQHTMQDLAEFYRTEKGLETLRNLVVIKLSELDMLKKKEVLV